MSTFPTTLPFYGVGSLPGVFFHTKTKIVKMLEMLFKLMNSVI